jgi:CBS domain-containing membrane protein
MPAPRIAPIVFGWPRAFGPEAISVDWRERLRVVLGATLGIGITALLCHTFGAPASPAWPWLVAPLGASAVLVFGVPASPLAQPWAVVGGNTLSALVGVLCVRGVGSPELAAALAVGGAIALYPVLANSLLLVLAGVAYNNATRRAYPHALRPISADTARDGDAEALDAALGAVLARYNQVLDISRDDLKALLEDTQLQAYQRKLANLRCGDIMSRELVTVARDTPLAQAWALFREHRIKALPVVGPTGHLVGIVAPADFIRTVEPETGDGFDVRLREVTGWARGPAGDRPQIVGQIMTRQVRVASVNRHLAELIPLFGSTGHHHIPVIDEGDKLAGIITQSDVVAALSRSG